MYNIFVLVNSPLVSTTIRQKLAKITTIYKFLKALKVRMNNIAIYDSVLITQGCYASERFLENKGDAKFSISIGNHLLI